MQDKPYLCLSLNISSRSYIWWDYYAYVESEPKKNVLTISNSIIIFIYHIKSTFQAHQSFNANGFWKNKFDK